MNLPVLQYLFAGLLLLHALIHFMGFVRTMKNDNSSGPVRRVPGGQGWLWLLTSLLLVLTMILVLQYSNHWLFAAMISLLLSQLLIVLNWRDAKWGTLVNVIILVAVLFVIAAVYLGSQAEKKDRTRIAATNSVQKNL